MSKSLDFQRWLIFLFIGSFISKAMQMHLTKYKIKKWLKAKVKFLVVMTNHSAYPTRPDKTWLMAYWITSFL